MIFQIGKLEAALHNQRESNSEARKAFDAHLDAIAHKHASAEDEVRTWARRCSRVEQLTTDATTILSRVASALTHRAVTERVPFTASKELRTKGKSIEEMAQALVVLQTPTVSKVARFNLSTAALASRTAEDAGKAGEGDDDGASDKGVRSDAGGASDKGEGEGGGGAGGAGGGAGSEVDRQSSVGHRARLSDVQSEIGGRSRTSASRYGGGRRNSAAGGSQWGGARNGGGTQYGGQSVYARSEYSGAGRSGAQGRQTRIPVGVQILLGMTDEAAEGKGGADGEDGGKRVCAGVVPD